MSSNRKHKYLQIKWDQAIIISLLVLLVISLAFKDVLSYFHFSWHREYITENLCINRFTPEKMCSGKCYLQATMEANREQEKKVPNPLAEKNTIIDFMPLIQHSLVNSSFRFGKKVRHWHFKNAYSCAHLQGVFRPPKRSIPHPIVSVQ